MFALGPDETIDVLIRVTGTPPRMNPPNPPNAEPPVIDNLDTHPEFQSFYGSVALSVSAAGGSVRAFHWITPAISATMSKDAMARFMQHVPPRICFIEPRYQPRSGETTFTEAERRSSRAGYHTVQAGCDDMGAAGYLAGLEGAGDFDHLRIALIDTGVSDLPPDQTRDFPRDQRYDCRSPGPGARQLADTDDAGLANGRQAPHGTLTHATLKQTTGRGVDSFRVYGDDDLVDVDAVVTAFTKVISAQYPVIVVEVQEERGTLSCLCGAADTVFTNYDAVVVAASGDTPEAAAPGCAACAIAVGAYHLHTPDYDRVPGGGGQVAGRLKPDILGPTDYQAVAEYPDVAQWLGGSSGATALVGGAAALVRGWISAELQKHNRARENIAGHVYAYLILAGQQPWPFAPDCDRCLGAGVLRLPPPDGGVVFDKAVLNSGDNVILAHVDCTNRSQLDAAIWWPEPDFGCTNPLSYNCEAHPGANHTSIFLHLEPPGGAPLVRSEDTSSVFQRATAFMPAGGGGEWKVRLTVDYMSPDTQEQEVYWAVWAH